MTRMNTTEASAHLAWLLEHGTPSPWRVSKVGLMNNGARAVSAEDARICEVDCHAEYKRGQGWLAECEIREANAALIAMAPDLAADVLRLSALITAARAIMTDPDPGSIETQRRIAAFMEATK